MATHSSILAWRTPQTEEHSRLQSIGSHRVGHDKSNLAHKGHLCSRESAGSLNRGELFISLHILPNTVKTFFSPMNAPCHSQQDGEFKECWTGWQKAL